MKKEVKKGEKAPTLL
jgi:hypothetical protein